MTTYTNEKEALAQELENHRAALKHFKNLEEAYSLNIKPDLRGTSECITKFYGYIEESIKKDIDLIRSRYEEI